MRSALILLLSLMLTGCASFINWAIPENVSARLSAKEIGTKQSDAKDSSGVASSTPKKDHLYALISESLDNCQTFQNGLFASIQEVNTTGDIVSIVLSTLGTVATPLTTIHALSAASALTAGTKSSYNADVFANTNVSNFNLAIHATYGNAMTDYALALDKLSETDVNVKSEEIKIKQIHQLCSLASAEAAIQTRLQPADAQTAISVNIGFDPASVTAGQASTLTVDLRNTADKDAVLTSDFVGNLPTGLQVAGPNSGTCANDKVTATTGATAIGLAKGATVPATGNCTIKVAVAASAPNIYIDIVKARALQTDRGANLQDVKAVLTVGPPAPGAVPPPVAAGTGGTVADKPVPTAAAAEGLPAAALASSPTSAGTQASTAIVPTTPVSVGLRIDPPTINPGGIAVLTLTLGTSSSKSAKLIADFGLRLPAALSVANSDSLGGTCKQGGNKIVAKSGGDTVAIQKGGVIPSGSCTLTVNVTAAAAGLLTSAVPPSALQTDQGSNTSAAKATLLVGSPSPLPPVQQNQPNGSKGVVTPAPNSDLGSYFKQ